MLPSKYVYLIGAFMWIFLLALALNYFTPLNAIQSWLTALMGYCVGEFTCLWDRIDSIGENEDSDV